MVVVAAARRHTSAVSKDGSSIYFGKRATLGDVLDIFRFLVTVRGAQQTSHSPQVLPTRQTMQKLQPLHLASSRSFVSTT